MKGSTKFSSGYMLILPFKNRYFALLTCFCLLAATATQATAGEPRTGRDSVQFIEKNYRKTLAPPAPFAAIPGINWLEQGPNNVGGRTRSLLVDPNDGTGNTVFAGSVSGGLWKTTNINSASPNWAPVNDLASNLAVTSIAADPSNTQVMYYCTGEGYGNADAVRGDGVWKSTDGGATWAQLASTTGATFDYCFKVAVNSTGVVFVATSTGGLQRSADGGTTWTKVLGTGLGITGAASNTCYDVEIAANGDVFTSLDGSVHKSTNAGVTFAAAQTLPITASRVELACAPNDANYVYAVVENGNVVNGILRTTNGGATWISRTEPADADPGVPPTDFSDGEAWYALAVAVDPTNKDALFVGGKDLFKSTDGANTWTEIAHWYGGFALQYVHGVQHNIVFQPGSGTVAYFVNNGGVYRTTDASAAVPTISDRNTNYRTAQFNSCAIHPTAFTNYYLGGTQDNGSQQFSQRGLQNTIEVTGGDGSFCHIDQDQPQFQHTSYSYNDFFRSSDNGNTWTNITSGSTGQYINPSDYADVSNRMYSGHNAGQYLRWDNPQTGSTFTAITIAAFSGGSVLAVKVSPNTANRVFFGLDNGDVVRVDNAHAVTPTATNISTGLPNGLVSCVEVETGNDNHLLVTYKDYGLTSVWESTDGGTSWTSVEGNLPDMPIRWALFNPNNSDQVMLATESGVWTTDNLNGGSTNWGASNTGMANVRVDMLQLRQSDKLVIAATHGRGLYTSDAFAAPTALFSSNKQVGYIGGAIQFTSESYQATSWSWDFGDGNTSTLENPTHTYSTAGKFDVTLTINAGASTLTKTQYIHILPNRGTPYLIADGGGFEVNTDDFGVENPNGTAWQRGNSTVAGKNGVHGGANAWVTGLTGDYVSDSETSLLTPNYNFTQPGTYTMSFWTKYTVETNFDGFRVQYTLDKGATWIQLGTTATGWYNYANIISVTAFPAGEAFFTGSQSSYSNKTRDLSFLAGNASVGFRIQFKSDVNVNSAGVAVDDFEITGPTNGASGNCPATGSVWYVDAAATSGGNGTAWACAFQNVQDAIDAASFGHEIWVKTGTHKPTKDPSGNAMPADPRDKVFYLKNGVSVYGGFAGTETLRSQRNWTTNPTILSGDIGTSGDNTDNCYHVVLSVSDGATTVLDGFTVEKGNADIGTNISVESQNVSRDRGAGLHNVLSSMVATNCIFSENTANQGAGNYNLIGSPTFTSCAFSGNTATGWGGGTYNHVSAATLTNCTYSGNSALIGGGVANNIGTGAPVTNCTFSNNSANSGGGMYNNTPSALTNCTFLGNTAAIDGGGLSCTSSSSTSSNIVNCLFSGNTSNHNGGGMYIYNSAPTVTNCTFSGNSATLSGGSIYNQNGTSIPILKNCLIWNNRAVGVTGSASASLNNTDLAPTFTYSLIQNHNPSGTGNLNGIPNAANSNYPNFVTPLDPATAPSTSGDFHITNCSPVLNLGTNTGAPATDLFGNARPFGSTVDIGIHELQAAPDATPPTIGCPPNQSVVLNGSSYTVTDFTSLSTASDNCASGAWTSQLPAVGAQLSAGSYTVVITATDPVGNTATCSFNLSVVCPATGTVWYVDAGATPNGNGASWACAFQNVQDAINAASSGHEIWVKAGTYLPTKDPLGNASPADPRDKVFYLKNGVAVYGGFAGTETLRNQRDWVANVTTLSGDIGTANDLTDNCYHVVISVSDAATTVLNGFTIEKGNANGSGSITVESNGVGRGAGGGLHNAGGTPTVANDIFSANSTGLNGGGMFNVGSSPAVTNCVFSANVVATGSSSGGAGMCNFNSANPTVTACKFLGNNAASYGGGMSNTSSSPTLTNCLFSGNVSTQHGGGAMANINASSPTLTNCTLSGNSSTVLSGGLASIGASAPVLTNCLIWNNRVGSTTGSALANMSTVATPVITYSLLQNQTPGGVGNLDGIAPASFSNWPDFISPLDPATAPSTSGDFHIGNCSPAANKGTNTGAPTTDLFGNARPFGANVDLGAHELQDAPDATPPSITCPANQTVTASMGGTYTTTDFATSASASDNCTNGILKTQSPAVGTSLSVGAQTVTLTATDAPGNTGTCSFTLTVQAACPAAGAIWYVDGAAAPGGTGTSWACAFQNVQDAINAASSGHEIWVKAGTYLPNQDPYGNTNPTNPRHKIFYLKDGVGLYGGFAGNEIARNQRDWVANVTKLSGDIGTLGDNTDNSYHVVISVNDGNATVLDGFTVEKGNANIQTSIVVESTAVLSYYGGGLLNTNSNLTTSNCKFSQNNANHGGGAANHGTGSPTFSACTFTQNTASNGGGLNSNAGTPTLNNCTFTQNTASWGGGASSTNAAPTYNDCAFTSNTASQDAGGIRLYNSGSTAFNRCTILGNSANNGYGGGIELNGTTTNAILTNCLIAGNTQSGAYSGGGIYDNGIPLTLIHCTVSGNKANSGGGGLYFSACNPVLTNCLVWNNHAGTTTGSANANLTLFTSTPGITYSLIQNHNPSGTGNLNGITYAADANYPNFVTPLDPATAPSTSGDFHLTACSPVLNLGTNTGAPTTDLYGNARPFGANVDLGVHEFQAAPTPAVAVCQNATVQLDGAGNGTLTASALNNGSTGCTPLSFSASQTNFTCSNLGSNTVTLTVTGYNGATSTCNATVTVADNVAPNALCRDFVKNLGTNGTATITAAEVDNLSNDNCGTVNLVGVSPNTFTCNPPSGGQGGIGMNTVTLTVNDGHGNTSTCNATVTVADNTAPTAVCQNITVNLSGNTATVTAAQVNNGSSDNCGTANLSLSTTSFSCASVGNNSVVLTVNDGHGNTSTCAATVTVVDNTNPTALCQNVSVNLGGGGAATVMASQVDNGSSDNCGVANLALSTTAFNCSNVGNNTVTLTVTDNNGRTATCTATVTVSDNTNPTATCQSATVNLDQNGSATLSAAQVDGGSSDNCGIASRSVSRTTFGVGDIGPNTVTLTVTDNNGRTATCTATVTVTNTNLPNAVCQPYTVALNSGGTATISAANVDGGSSAVGGIQSMGVSPSSFNCSNLGNNTVVLTVTGNNGLSATCNAVVTVQDNTPPTAVCQNITVNLNGNSATITASQINNGSTDNCGTATAQSVSQSSFSCAHLGPNTVTLTVADGSGNTATCTATVTVRDVTPPTAICQNITVNLSGNSATITASQLNNGSTDNCGTPTAQSVSPSSFTCSNVGPNTVILTVSDGSGNTATCTATVTVRDNTAPTALCRDVVLQLDGSGNAALTAAQVNNGSSDNCALGTLTVNPNAFTLANLGQNTVTLTVPDVNGNASTCTAVVTVENNQLPNAVCQNIARNLGANGTVTITAADVDGGSTALGGIANRSVSPTVLNCSNIGPATVTLTITGNNNQQASCNATVTVSDVTPPTAVCQNITVNLSGGTASVAASQVNNGSTDNCGAPSLGLSTTSFTCANLGANTVILTASDGSGNTATCTATVTVRDVTPPTAICQNVTVNLSGNTATVTASQVNNGSTDNCGSPSLGLSATGFTCANLGANTVTLTASDGSGNTATCTATVTVRDVTAPTALCQNITVNLSGNSASATASQVNNGSSDNCGTPSLGLSTTNFTCANLGANTVTLTASDGSNNTATCTATVTVRDVTPPTALCQNITVNLSGGSASVTASQVNNGSSDNCGTPSLGLSTTNFTCGNLGANTVTLTASDGSGNTATCTATVTVRDVTPPTAICQNITVNLSGNSASVTASQVNNSSTDNCGTATAQSVSQSSFTCAHLGPNTVTLTVSDGSGNTAICTATVTVRDVTPPTALCQNITVNLSGSTATVTASQVNNSSTDNCGTATAQSVSQSSFTCSNLGPNTVTLTVSDGSGNTATCTATVTVRDVTPPTALCQNITVNLSGNSASVSASQLNNASMDNCGSATAQSVSQSGFTCSNLGPNTVTLTVADGSGNTATCTAVVTVRDNTPPTALCQNITVNLNGGSANITASQLNNGSTDNCGTATPQSVSQSGFTCSNLGPNTVTLTVSDGSGNTATCTATVTVRDVTPPTALCQNITVNLSGGTTTITASQVNNGSTDNCGTATAQSVSQSSFTCSNLGPNTVTLTVADGSNNTATCTATVTVRDVTPPTALCQNITVNLSGGNASITASQINNGSSDNCGTPSLGLSTTSFTCANLGANTVTLTASDGSNNTATCTATVTIQASEINLRGNGMDIADGDNTPSSADHTDFGQTTGASVVRTFTVQNTGAVALPVTGIALGGTNASQFSVGALNPASPIPAGQSATFAVTYAPNITGVHNATVTITNGDCDEGTYDFAIRGELTCSTPTFTACPTATVELNTPSNGCAATATYNVAANGLPTPALTYTFTGATTGSGNGTGSGLSFNKGTTTVAVTATNPCGAPTCTFSVRVTDNVPPSITCPTPMTVSNTSGQCGATITYTPTVSDNCSGATFALISGPASGSLFPVGTTAVQLQATDAAGLTATCVFTVRVNDTELPSIACPNNIIRSSDANACGAVVTYTNPTYSDNCSGAGLDHLSGGTSGSTFPVGTTNVVWKATDAANNTRTCLFSITVNDAQAPTITCPANMTRPTTTGQCAAQVTFTNPAASDNCAAPTLQWVSGGTSTVQGPSTSTGTFGKGTTTVQWKATDGAGLTKTCTFRVIVNDTEAPTMSCPAGLNVNASPGQCGAAVTYSTPTYTDNCAPTSGTSVRVSGPASGSFFAVGTTNVVFRATDAASNTRQCTLTVTVTDNQPPTISCPPSMTVTGSGTPCNATAFYSVPTASDNCAGTLNPYLVGGLASGSVYPAGTTVNTWRALDPNGMTAQCAFTVTVNCPTVQPPSGAEDRVGATSNLSLAPNPAATEVAISIQGEKGTSGTLLVYDATGRLIWQQTSAAVATVRLDVSAWPSGVYAVSWRQGKTVLVKRLTVARG